jgi:hypothetical protein
MSLTQTRASPKHQQRPWGAPHTLGAPRSDCISVPPFATHEQRYRSGAVLPSAVEGCQQPEHEHEA